MILIKLLFIILINPLPGNWLLSDADISACPGGSGQFFLDGFDQNCVDIESGRICHELYMNFDKDGTYNMRVETRSVESGDSMAVPMNGYDGSM